MRTPKSRAAKGSKRLNFIMAIRRIISIVSWIELFIYLLNCSLFVASCILLHYSFGFSRFLTRSISFIGLCRSISSRRQMVSLNQGCCKAFFAVIRFFGLIVSRSLSKSTPSGLRPYSPFGIISASLSSCWCFRP